jgi:L-fuconolactonase
MPLRIDAHQHFWRPARSDYGWLDARDPGLAPLYRDIEPAELRPLLQAHGVSHTVLVQAAPSEAETDFMLALADATPFIAGVVGWVDVSRADSVATLRRWAAHPAFKGVRPMLQDLPEADWIARAPHPAVVEALLELGLRFDALVKPPHLAALLRFIDRWPTLPVVVDHAAKPQLADGWTGDWPTAWRSGLAEIAARPHVLCKLSGLLTEAGGAARAGGEAGRVALQPVWRHLLDTFGAARLVWGSDWPVLNLAADYGAWVALSEALIGTLAPAQQRAVWHDNAQSFYGLTLKAADAASEMIGPA